MKTFLKLWESAETNKERNAIIQHIKKNPTDFTSFLILADHFIEHEPINELSSEICKYISVNKVNAVPLSSLEIDDEFIFISRLGSFDELCGFTEFDATTGTAYYFIGKYINESPGTELVYPIGDDFEKV